MSTYPDIVEAFVDQLHQLLTQGHPAEPITDPDSPASEFGAKPQWSFERFGATFTVGSVENNIVSAEACPFNLTYGVGLLLWTLAASHDIDWIAYYRGARPKGKKVAFGHRLFRGDLDVDLVRVSLTRLRQDPGTRRAYMPIFTPKDFVETDGEIPCAAGLHFHRRGGTLHAVVLMRAQNAISALPMDFFLFSSLLNYAASLAGLKVGTYTHVMSTLHAFESDRERANNIARGGIEQIEAVGLGSMDSFASDLESLLRFESNLRRCVLSRDVCEIKRQATLPLCFTSAAANTLQSILATVAMRKIGNVGWCSSNLHHKLRSLLAA